MGRESDAMINRQERKYRRFDLECPVFVRYQANHSASEVYAISQNVSIGGLLMMSASMIPDQTPVTFIIKVRADTAKSPIYLAGEGEIVRVERNQDNRTFAIAVVCRTPIIRLEEYSPSV